jgi:endonuclease/exonuclease/phosphatase family metal-dependent hydrolase
VLHWNLHHGNDPYNRWAFPRQMEVIYKANADVISLNEVEKFNSSYGDIDQAAEIVKYLKAKTGKAWYHYMRVGSGSSTGIGNAVISRFPITSTSHCQLSGSRNAVQMGVTVNGRTLNLWSTHLAVESGSYRRAEAKALVACMNNFSQQRVVAGDFNAQAGSTELDVMTEDYVDMWAKAKSMRATGNYSGNCDGCTRNSRIDYMFASKEATHLVLKSAQIMDTRNAGGTMASDHKPMLVTYTVK